jgi:hypothetical protein
MVSCKQKATTADLKIIYLHHSTGGVIWNGETSNPKKANLPLLFEAYNKEQEKIISIEKMEFPKAQPYGWNNYPYDYYNIWVKNAGTDPFMEEPTLEILTKEYQVIIFKHCYPVSNIQSDQNNADINSELKTISNYKLQYNALRDKLHEFPDTKFILFTGAVNVKSNLTEDEAMRTKEFFKWVIDEWDIPGDNIYLWDLYNLETEGGLYFKDDFAVSATDSHPNKDFAGRVVKLLFNRIIDVIENDGSKTQISGEVI